MPRYAEAVDLCIELGLWANVEIKPAKGLERATGSAVAAMSEHLWRAAPLRPLLSSFSAAALESAREAAPGLSRGLLVGDVPPDWRERLREHGCVSLHCDHRRLTQTQAQSVREAGYALLCYTVNEAETACKLFARGVDAIVSDRLDLIGCEFGMPG